MFKLSQIPYNRINFERIKASFSELISLFSHAESIGEAINICMEINGLYERFNTAAVLSERGFTMDTKDPFYRKEEEFFNDAKAEFAVIESEFHKAIISSRWKNDLEIYLGTDYIDRMDLKANTINESILPLLKRENLLSQRYSEITAQLKIQNNGIECPLAKYSASLDKYDVHKRRKQHMPIDNAWSLAKQKLDEVYQELVVTRDRIAKASGFKNYCDYSYAFHGRTSYTKRDIHKFREAVARWIVPLATKLMNDRQKQLGVDKLLRTDEDILLNSIEVPDVKELLKGFGRIYAKLSPETDLFFANFLEAESYDLEPRDGKILGAYSNYIPFYGMSFVFMTYQQGSKDIKTFAHETGHAFNSFCHRAEPFYFSKEPTSDLAEIHSMAMEFLIWPYLDELLDAESRSQYMKDHLTNALTFIPYGCAVDEFQERIYTDPRLGPDDRLEVWKELEQKYTPWRSYASSSFGSEGRAWQMQTHIYKWPFYYIDYVLAQFVSIQIQLISNVDKQEAWRAYRRVIENSGSLSFVDTVINAGLEEPFNDSAVEKASISINEMIEKFNERRDWNGN